MLRELPPRDGGQEGKLRRWFFSQAMDLAVWLDGDGDIVAFQLAYDKPHREHSVVWRRDQPLRHFRVDEGIGHIPKTPLLLEDGPFDAKGIGARFLAQAAEVPAEIRQFVLRRLAA